MSQTLQNKAFSANGMSTLAQNNFMLIVRKDQ